MKILIAKSRPRNQGWALLIVMGLAATGLLMVANIMNWSNENTAVTARNGEYFATTYAAESATEKAVSAIMQDYENYGAGWVQTRNAANIYSSLIPTGSDGAYWSNYQFSGGTTANAVLITMVNANVNYVAGPPYTGLAYGGPDYQIIANARNTSTMYHLMATVGQEVVLGQIPIFQFAIFYNDLLEIDPGANMVINGVVHGNNNIYIDPNSGVSLTFYNDVSGSGNVLLSQNPLDPSSRPATGAATFNGNDISGVNPLFLPVGTNVSGNTTNQGSVYAILQVPPPGESAASTVGSNRLYNQCDMIITISNGNVITVTSGMAINNAATTISNNQWASWISTNGSFYNMRDGTQVAPLDINIGAMKKWSATNTVLRNLLAGLSTRGALGADVQSIYVVDQRFLSNTVITTNYTYTTNTAVTTTSSYPGTGTYVPPVNTNSTVTTSPTFPAAGTYLPPIQLTNTTGTTTTNRPGNGTYIGSISTNAVATNSVAYPIGGTYQGSVATNTTVTTNSSYPTTGTYTGTVTNKNGKYVYNLITGYGYNLIQYSYNLISGYIFNGITGYTYSGITGIITNAIYTTNYIQYAEPGIVLTNGGALPTNGLSVVTPDPAYIVGNWNCTNTSGQGMLLTSNVTDTLPSAIFADAITILSSAWNPNNSTNSLTGGTRNAASDTVTAAFFTGIVPSDGNNYSGGVENFPRFQENWSGVNFYYNGSMVEMFVSQIANAPWPGTGVVYNPPNRNWSYDINFSNPNGLPPLTPRAMYPSRVRWSSLPPGATSF